MTPSDSSTVASLRRHLANEIERCAIELDDKLILTDEMAWGFCNRFNAYGLGQAPKWLRKRGRQYAAKYAGHVSRGPEMASVCEEPAARVSWLERWWR